MSKGAKKKGNPEDLKQEEERNMFECKVRSTELRLAYTVESCEQSNQAQQELQRETAKLAE